MTMKHAGLAAAVLTAIAALLAAARCRPRAAAERTAESTSNWRDAMPDYMEAIAIDAVIQFEEEQIAAAELAAMDLP